MINLRDVILEQLNKLYTDKGRTRNSDAAHVIEEAVHKAIELNRLTSKKNINEIYGKIVKPIEQRTSVAMTVSDLNLIRSALSLLQDERKNFSRNILFLDVNQTEFKKIDRAIDDLLSRIVTTRDMLVAFTE